MENGAIAQLGERLTGSQEVRGSIPLGSTIENQQPRRFQASVVFCFNVYIKNAAMLLQLGISYIDPEIL